MLSVDLPDVGPPDPEELSWRVEPPGMLELVVLPLCVEPPDVIPDEPDPWLFPSLPDCPDVFSACAIPILFYESTGKFSIIHRQSVAKLAGIVTKFAGSRLFTFCCFWHFRKEL